MLVTHILVFLAIAADEAPPEKQRAPKPTEIALVPLVAFIAVAHHPLTSSSVTGACWRTARS